jgi:acetoin utilization deacetylase AcuC-like enzyme
MAVLLYTDERFREHDTGPHHPERASRMGAVATGLSEYGLSEALTHVTPRPATDDELRLVHPEAYVSSIERFCASGGGHLDADTVVSTGSAIAARLAAGAGIDAVERLRAGEATSAFLAVRPPGHHATATRSMGFCLFNSAAVCAASLAATGERVMVVDVDAHHGNGTQDIFYDRDDVTYVSWHQDPLYPGTGRSDQWGTGRGVGHTLNLPMPPGATGEHYRRSIEQVVAPLAERIGVTWLVISAGYDGHRHDPLTDLGLTSGDFADITADLISLVEPGRTVVLLEGGYELRAVADSAAATVGALLGEHVHPEPPSAGGPGSASVDQVAELRRRFD